MHDARDLANLLLDLADERSFSFDNASLNILLFIVNGNYVSDFGANLIVDDFVASEDGPVIMNVFNAFSAVSGPICGKRASRFDPFSEQYYYVPYEFRRQIVEYCEFILSAYSLGVYGGLAAVQGQFLKFWRIVEENEGQKILPQHIIPSAVIAAHFSKLKSQLSS